MSNREIWCRSEPYSAIACRSGLNKLDSLPVRDLTEDDELYAWEGNYDPLFLGYMAEVVPALERGNDPGAAVI